jgi:hypothetical protein
MPKGIVIDARNETVEEREFTLPFYDELEKVLEGPPAFTVVLGAASWFMYVNDNGRGDALPYGFRLHKSAPVWGNAVVFGRPDSEGIETDAPMSADELKEHVHFSEPLNVFVDEPFDTGTLSRGD